MQDYHTTDPQSAHPAGWCDRRDCSICKARMDEIAERARQHPDQSPWVDPDVDYRDFVDYSGRWR